MHFKNYYLAAVCVLVLTACGGGGGGTSTTPSTGVSGLAATGAAVGGAAVTARCVTGTDVTATTASDGSFTLDLGSRTLPCMVKVANSPTDLYSFVTTYGRINVTPLTDLAIAAAGGDTPANLFAAFNSATAASINAGLAAAKTYVGNQISGLEFNAISIDIFTGTFAIGDSHDKTLDELDYALTDAAKTLNDLRNLAKTSQSLATDVTNADIVISEVASGYFPDTPFWFEIANRGPNPVNLNGFSVRTSGSVLNVSPFTTGGRQSFALPNVTLASGAFLVVSGQTAGNLSNTSQVVYINDSVTASKVPAWTASGSIELIKGGQTRSFVRFGTNNDLPTTGTVSYTAAALPYSATDYSKSIVRYGTSAASMSAANSWSSVTWTTPAGPNDVPVAAVDADGDGIPDSAEVEGATFAGINLYAMGARTGRKDILVQVDYMNSADPGVRPQKQAFENVKAAFAAKNINMILDVGSLFGDAANSGYNWGGGRSIASATCIALGTMPGCSSLYQIKAQHFDVRRISLFHYAIFGTSQNSDGSAGTSGVAELPGNDLIVTLGNWGLNTSTTSNTNKLINYQAGTFMHELGHNLNLKHGGFENTNYKPNYFSIMNYIYQLDGLSSSASGIGPFERWRCEQYEVCDFTESARTSNSMAIDYSDGSSVDLNENALLESANIGRGATNTSIYADWNNSGTLNGVAYAMDISLDGILSSALKDYNDWANLVFPFSRTYTGAFGVRMVTSKTPTTTFDPMSNDRQPFIVETLHAPRH